MNKENTAKLMEKYSFLRVAEDPFIRKGNESMLYDLMLFGIETGDGWYNLIDNLCATIVKTLKEEGYSEDTIKADQVKEKFGGLRFYYHFEKEVSKEVQQRISEVIGMTEEQSFRTCEVCGKVGKLEEANSWYSTKCDECRGVWDE